VRKPLAKFFRDRGTHLAAMIAYFALVSFVPLVFLALALLGLAHRADASDFFVRELDRAFPSSSLDTILRVVHTIQDNAAALGILGGIFLLWSSLSLFSALESAFNIVYGQPNRSFLHGKVIAALLMIGSVVTLFGALVVGSFGIEVLRTYGPAFLTGSITSYVISVAASLVGIFVFLEIAYARLTNAEVTWREALPGAILASIVLEASFQLLPLFVRYASVNVTLRALGGPALLLIWLYLMANVIVFGAELNWWRANGREEVAEREAEEAPGLA
jgi:YihY family inner membrane protein